jgi:hypothetical protein
LSNNIEIVKNGFRYDRVLKDLFQRDHPSLLDQLAGGLRVREFLNVEFPKVIERRADLAVLLEDETILHVEFQSHNDKDIAYREGMYCLMIAQKYWRRVRQVVLYVGQPKMRMEDRLDLGDTKVAYRLLDIREIDAGELLRSGRPGDLVLAMLAKGGTERLTEIARRIVLLSGAERSRALTQLMLLSSLRALSGSMRMELNSMASDVIDIEKIEFFRDKIRDLEDQAQARGLAKGRGQGMVHLLRELMQTKFGPLPKWAEDRLSHGSPTQVERWARKVLAAKTLESVLGKK